MRINLQWIEPQKGVNYGLLDMSGVRDWSSVHVVSIPGDEFMPFCNNLRYQYYTDDLSIVGTKLPMEVNAVNWFFDPEVKTPESEIYFLVRKVGSEEILAYFYEKVPLDSKLNTFYFLFKYGEIGKFVEISCYNEAIDYLLRELKL